MLQPIEHLKMHEKCKICPRKTHFTDWWKAWKFDMSCVCCSWCRQCLRFDVFFEKWTCIISKENINRVHESSVCFSCCLLPVTSCVSSWLLLLTMLTDTFLEDCRNSGRPCEEMDKVICFVGGAVVCQGTKKRSPAGDKCSQFYLYSITSAFLALSLHRCAYIRPHRAATPLASVATSCVSLRRITWLHAPVQTLSLALYKLSQL